MKRRYNIFYFIKEAFSGLIRNGVMSFASIAVLLSLLVVTGGFALLVLNIDKNLEQFGLMKEIVVFCDIDLDDTGVDEIGEQIKKLDNIESVNFISKSQALADMKEQYEVYSDVSEEENPLPASYVITYVDNEKVPELDYQLKQIEGISKVNNRLDLATSIENLKSGIMLVFIWFLAILMIVSLFVIINTIKLSVFARRNEITVMRYVGATGWFITLPFVFEGIIIGLFSSVIGFLAEWYVYRYIENMVMTDLQMITIVRFSDISNIALIAFVGVGVLVGIIGSSISLGRYLDK